MEDLVMSSCACKECNEYGGPDPTIMNLRLSILASHFLLGIFGLIYERKWKLLGAMLGSIVFFFTIPRRLICARCPGYGKRCYALLLGLATSKIMPKVEGKDVPGYSLILETLALMGMTVPPMLGFRKNWRLLIPYMALVQGTAGLQFLHACRHCAYNAKEGSWQNWCPVCQIARVVYGVEK